MATYFERSLAYPLRITSNAYGRRLLAELEAAGTPVSLPQWLVLVFLYHNDGQNQQRLGDFASKDKAGITRVVDVLEAQGLVRRVQDAQDRRANCVHITPEGRAYTERLMDVATQMHARALKGIPPQDLATTERVLNTILQNLA